MTLDWALVKTPDFVGAYVNALKAGQEIGRQATPPADPREQIAALDGQGRAAAARRAEILGAIGAGLRQAPYAQRRSILAHVTPALAAQGLDPAAVAAFDPTNANLDAHVATAMSLAKSLAASPPAPAPAADPAEAPVGVVAP